jgi:acetyl esterase/lipase
VTARIIAVPGPGLDGPEAVKWGDEAGIPVEVRPADPVAVLRSLDRDTAGVIVVPGAAGLQDPALAGAVAAFGLPVVAAEPGNLRKAGPAPEDTAFVAAGGRVIYGRGPDTVRHAVVFLARRRDRLPDTLAYGPEPSQEGDLWLPATDGPHPVALLLHGGFWYHAWERDLMDGLARDLAARGIAAWNVEYRRVGAGGGWPVTGHDAGRATEHLAALAPVYGLDLGRVAVLGHSAGAQLALWVAARGRRASVHPALVVGLATIADLDAARADRIGGGSVTRLLDHADAGPDGALPNASPIERLPIGVPQILAHAVDDDVVPSSQTTRYAAAAIAGGDDVTVLQLEAGGHFDLIDPRTTAWATVAAAVEARLGAGRPARPAR